MSNLSLKEQLEALSLKEKEKPTKNFRPNAVKQKPLWLEQAQYGVELLKAYFPLCFREIKEIKPLKIGIKQDLVKRLSTMSDLAVTDKACMVTSLSYYVNSPAYHKSVVENAVRIDLDGESVGKVSTEEAHYSLERRKTKLQKKSTEVTQS